MKLIPPDSTAATTPALPLPGMPPLLKKLFLAGTALTVFLFAMVFAPGSRGYGGPGGWGEGILYLIGAALSAGIVIWSFICWLVYRSLHTQGRGKRIGITLLFFLLPPILLAGSIGWDWLKGYPGRTETKADAPTSATLAGVVFPAGSKLEYEQDGQFGRVLVGATARKPLAFGTLQVTGIRLTDPPDERHLRLSLPAPQTIDGWNCSEQQHVDVSNNNGVITLDYCTLAGQTIADSIWPPGTLVESSADGWSVYASTLIDPSSAETCAHPSIVAGVPYVQVQATYDLKREKLSIDYGTPCTGKPAQ
ncbi:hypothetical protein [Chitinilyticum aquatile]|uniref:hypothetical protein n=1 Tax=Chitinilyticum aquatile TaxID=362520 RepID=UPI0003F7303D|nr:hypothetical protein [Chitinilyticum aquatile]